MRVHLLPRYYPLIQILSMPVFVFCVVELLFITRVCTLCKLLITHRLPRAKLATITDSNRKVVISTEIAVGYINHFLLLPLKFVIWSLRGLLASELHCSTIHPVVMLDLCFSRCSCQQCNFSSTVCTSVVW